MNEIAFVWALWAMGGGRVNSGYLNTPPQPVAYFATVHECDAVRQALPQDDRLWYRCIGAKYIKNSK